MAQTEWAVYARTGGGYIATPDDPKKGIKRYCWITADGTGFYKEWGQPVQILGIFKNIREVVEASRKLG